MANHFIDIYMFPFESTSDIHVHEDGTYSLTKQQNHSDFRRYIQCTTDNLKCSEQKMQFKLSE